MSNYVDAATHTVGLLVFALNIDRATAHPIDSGERLDLTEHPDIRAVVEKIGKAGTLEHVHDVVKNELGGGFFPSGRFGANAAWFRFALLTYNVLSAMKHDLGKNESSSLRNLRTSQGC